MQTQVFNQELAALEGESNQFSRQFIQWLRTLVAQSNYALTFDAVNAALAEADATVDFNGQNLTGIGSLTSSTGDILSGFAGFRCNGSQSFALRDSGDGGGAIFIFQGRSKLSSPADGSFLLTDNAGTGFTALHFGGSTSSFPAIKRNGAGLEFKLADDSAHTLIVCQTVASGIASISSANITGTSAGQLGHAQGVSIVSAPGAGYALEFVSGVVINDFATAAYTGGGNVSFAYAGGGPTLSAAVSYANSVGGAADKIALVAASVPTNNQLVANTGINLVCAAAPTNPGTAAGVLRVKVTYRIHTTGL